MTDKKEFVSHVPSGKTGRVVQSETCRVGRHISLSTLHSLAKGGVSKTLETCCCLLERKDDRTSCSVTARHSSRIGVACFPERD
jgi:hypothetical protein